MLRLIDPKKLNDMLPVINKILGRYKHAVKNLDKTNITSEDRQKASEAKATIEMYNRLFKQIRNQNN